MTIEYQPKPESLTVRGADDLCRLGVVVGLYVDKLIPDETRSISLKNALHKAGEEMMIAPGGWFDRAGEAVDAENNDPRLKDLPEFQKLVHVDGVHYEVVRRGVLWAAQAENLRRFEDRISGARRQGEALRLSPRLEEVERKLWEQLGQDQDDELGKVFRIHEEAKALADEVSPPPTPKEKRKPAATVARGLRKFGSDFREGIHQERAKRT